VCFAEITCPRCSSRNITKNGTTANEKQKYWCKDCRRQFITHYTYRGRQPFIRDLVVPMTMNSTGIRDIARLVIYIDQEKVGTMLVLVRLKSGDHAHCSLRLGAAH